MIPSRLVLPSGTLYKCSVYKIRTDSRFTRWTEIENNQSPYLKYYVNNTWWWEGLKGKCSQIPRSFWPSHLEPGIGGSVDMYSDHVHVSAGKVILVANYGGIVPRRNAKPRVKCHWVYLSTVTRTSLRLLWTNFIHFWVFLFGKTSRVWL